MPRSGTRSKRSRGKARKAATPRDPTPPAPANAFAALAAPEEEEPSDGEEEEPEPEQKEQDAAPFLLETNVSYIVGLVHKNHIMRTRLMYHVLVACKIEFQPFKRLCSQLTFFNFLFLFL